MKSRSDEGRDRLARAQRSFDVYRETPPGARTKEQVNSMRQLCRSAMDWLEEGPDFDKAHHLLDQIGRLVRTTDASACRLKFENDRYTQTCPVALAHSRVGMSVEMLVKESHCSVCGGDLWECPHITGRQYDGQVCVRVVTRAEALGVALVARPAMPDARIMEISVTKSELVGALGDTFVYGTLVVCDRCLTPCDGLNRKLESMDPADDQRKGAA